MNKWALYVAATLLATSIPVSVAPAAQAANNTCNWTYSKNRTFVSGFCYGEPVTLSRRGRSLRGFIGQDSVALYRRGRTWTGFIGQDSVALTRVGPGVWSGFVGTDSRLCNGPLPVTCLA